ncbi:MAG TPA: hypothetical protein VH249_24885 [Xanthobacteraceae bacterium]|jgi:hypothetical protein|nr:hypothetical protein [Xanthobacteraceae bacterium]
MRLDGIDQAGFAPRSHARVRRNMMMAQLITSLALMLSIAVAATAVSIGIAHAGGVVAATVKPGK